MTNRASSRWLAIWFLVVSAIGLGTILAFRAYTGTCLEDAWITFRYADNIASGRGFVYNAGERVLGTTTPLQTLLLAGVGTFWGPHSIPNAAFWILLIATAFTAWFTFQACLLIGVPRIASLLVAGVFLIHPDTLWTTAGGMETPLVVLWMALSFYALAAKKYPLAAVACALLVLTRPDGIVWSACLAMMVFATARRSFFPCLLVFLALLLPWFIFATLYFESPIPHSIIAKRVIIADHYSLMDWGDFIERVKRTLRYVGAVAPFKRIIGLLLFAVGSCVVLKRLPKPAWVFVVFPPWFGILFLLGHAPWFPWYLVPAGWCAIIVGAIGLWFSLQWIADFLRGLRGLQVAAPLVYGLFLLLYLGMMIYHDVREADFQLAYQRNEDGLRRRIGEWLRDNTPIGATVAMEAIGYQGYFSERRILDLAGLVSPEVVEIHRQYTENADAFHVIIRELMPDFIVLRSFEVVENRHFHGGVLFADPAQRRFFSENYHEVKWFSAPLPGLWGRQAHQTIFRRRS